jgi:pimeloyl-ACP methyl ester carboxylesterase
MQATEIELQTPGMTLAGLSWGTVGNPVILAFHGWLDNAASFSRLAPILASSGRRVIAIDLPGHGRSDHRSPDAQYHYINNSIDVVAIVDALGLETFDLLGHSMGVGVGLLAAAGFGPRVGRVFAIEGLGPMTTEADEVASTFRVAAEAHSRVRDRNRGIYSDAEAAIARKAAAIGTDLDTARPIALRSLVPVSGGVQFGDDPRLSGRSFLRLTESQVQGFLRAVEAPVAVVRATDGLSYPEGAMEARLACLQDVDVRTLSGHHHLHLSSPDRVARALGFPTA